MSMFGLMGDLEEDPIFGVHMRSMRQMNSMMNIFGMPGMFGNSSPLMLSGPTQSHHHQHHQNMMMPFGFPSMPNMNQMMSFPDMHHGHGRGNGMASYSSSSFMSMTSGPDGRPQIYQASSSTQAGPGGVVETKKSVQDSRTGIKKMAIGHHIGERGHIIEREQNYHEGTQEEREDFINLEEEEAEDFNREFVQKSRRNQPTIQCIDGPQGGGGRREMLAITNGPSAASTSGDEEREPDLIEEVDDDEEDDVVLKSQGRQWSNSQKDRVSPIVVVVEDDNDSRVTAPVMPEPRRKSKHDPIHGRRPIRTHTSSPLATNSNMPGQQRMGHPSHRTTSSVHHPYSGTHSRKSHRPMKSNHNQSHQQNNPHHHRGADN